VCSVMCNVLCSQLHVCWVYPNLFGILCFVLCPLCALRVEWDINCVLCLTCFVCRLCASHCAFCEALCAVCFMCVLCGVCSL